MARPPYPGRLHYFIGSKTRALLIEQLVRHLGTERCFRELGREVRTGMGALHRELTELQRIGLVRSSVRGGARYFALEIEHPLARALRDLVAACDELDSCVSTDRSTPLSGS
jgi:DNA-binding HxlR family transcriptional regulator